MAESLRRHWPEYAIEALLLGSFMLSACLFGVLLEHPLSPARAALPDPLVRRVLMGLAMGLTAVAIIYSPLGMRSGAHINPSVTLTFLRLGKVKPADALFYVGAQFAGAALGVALAWLVVSSRLADPAVNWVVTAPGSLGSGAAFAGELAISFVLMLVVLASAASPRLERLTGLFAGLLVAAWIALEAPLSGMSMNPARTFGSALFAGAWRGAWIYFVAPLLGMLGAAELHRRLRGPARVPCAKLHHRNRQRCIFCGKRAALETP